MFWENMEFNVGDKVWKENSNLGLIPKGKSRDYRKKISEIEAKDKVRKEVSKATNKPTR